MAPEPTALLLDIQATQSRAHSQRGIARYTASLATELLARPGRVRRLLLNPEMPAPSALPPPLAAHPLLTWHGRTALAGTRDRENGALWLMSPFEFPEASTESAIGAQTAGLGLPLYATVYDLIPLLMPARYLQDPPLRRRYLSRIGLIQHAQLVFCISEWTRRTVIEHCGLGPEHVVNVGAAVDAHFAPRPATERPDTALLARFGLNRAFLFTLLGDDPRKNLDGLLAAFGHLPGQLQREHQVLVAGGYGPEARARFAHLAATAGLAEDALRFTGPVSEAELLELYRAARLFVFPSLAEGFGLPIAEAAACGCPTLASNATACPEVLELASATFLATDAADMARAIERGLTDASFRAELAAQGRLRAAERTWSRVADRCLDAIDRLPRRARHIPTPRPRIALIGPLPDDASGVADYNERMAAELAQLAELDVFIPEAGRHARRPRRPYRVLPQEAYGSAVSPYGYDALLYSFGNSSHYIRSLDLFRQFPGIAWCHDVRLYSLFLNAVMQRHPPAEQRAQAVALLAGLYGPDVPGGALDDPFDIPQVRQRDIGFMPGIVRHARALLLHSRHACELLRADLPPGLAPPPIHLIPLAVPPVRATPVRPDRPRPVVATFGIQHPTKAPETLIDAAARLAPDLPVDLAFVGPIDPAYRDELLARAAGLPGRVTVTGHVEISDYARWLDTCDCAVQLRANSHGESSAAVGDALARGLPVLTNIAACADAPPDTVLSLDGPPDAARLAAALTDVLTRPETAARHRAAALRYAGEHSFARTARRILAAALETGPALPPPPR